MTLDLPTPRAFFPLLKPSRYKGAYGGRGSGKSHFFAEMAIEAAATRNVDIVCLREVQQTLDESVKKLLEDKIEQLNLGAHFQVQHNRILGPFGNRIIFMGMKDQNAHSIKSLQGYGIAWFEEAQAMSHRSLELLRPTIREPGSELWFSWNPDKEDNAVEQFLRGPTLPEDAVVVQANWRDNPWFPPELEKERLLDMAMFPKRYRHVWEGDFGRDGDPFFEQDWLLPPVDIDWRIDQVFATIDTAQKDGSEHDGTGVVIWGRSVYEGVPLVILDWDVVQVKANLLIQWLPGIHQLLEHYARQYRARQGSLGCWIEDMASGIQLLQCAEAAGMQVHAIDSKLTSAGKEGRAIAASPHVYQGKVKFSRHAFDKTTTYRGATKNHLLDQVCGFRMGMKKREHLLDLLDCFTYGCAIALGNSDGY